MAKKLPQDRFGKQPTQRQMFEMQMMQQMQQMYSILRDLDTRITSLSRAKMDPDTMALFMLDIEANKDYLKKLDAALDAEVAKKKSQAETAPQQETPQQ